jgi:hypothetical protein
MGMFPKGTQFTNMSGHFADKYYPMAMVEGKEYSRFRTNPETRTGKSTQRWVSKSGRTSVGDIDIRYLGQHFKLAYYSLEKNSLNFVIVLSERAQAIFQGSFSKKKFNSADGQLWQPLSEHTISKRKKHKTTPVRMLQEMGELLSSIKTSKPATSGFSHMASVYTDPKAFKATRYPSGHKRRAICYAAIHNEGSQGGYSFGKYRAVRRQFMGHSTYFLAFSNSIIRKYLFDDVFLTRKR